MKRSILETILITWNGVDMKTDSILPFYPIAEKTRKYANEFSAITKKVCEKGQFILGEEVQLFENEFSIFQNSKYVLGVGNGLDALKIGLLALGLKPGDKVAVPAFTFVATWFAVTEIGAIPVPIDVSELDAGMDLDLIIEQNVKALIYVHLYGIPKDLTELSNKLRKSNIYLIEDCAQAHGAKINGKQVGNFGDFGCFSFYPTKNLGALGDGGAITTSNESLFEKAKMLRSYGTLDSKYVHLVKGSNSRLDELQAGFLRFNLSLLESETLKRVEIANLYDEALNESEVLSPLANTDKSVFHLYIVRTKSDRSKIVNDLLTAGLITDVHYPIAPINQACFKELGIVSTNYPITNKLEETVVSLPMYPWMNSERIERTVSILRKLGKN